MQNTEEDQEEDHNMKTTKCHQCLSSFNLYYHCTEFSGRRMLTNPEFYRWL